MEALARAAGVFLTPEWTQNCTHLVMEQLAITPKLLCCIADGGVAVAASFLRALAACDQGGPIPDPAAHRPRPPVGVDAAYEAKLTACFDAPMPRHAMLKGVWVIFGLRQAYDALSIALLHAGSQVHLLCTTEVQATKVAEDLKLSVTSHGVPREVWLVPGVEERLGTLLASPLRELGTRCLTVTHGAVVAGILAGSLDAVHAEATPFACQAAPVSAASFPETQRQGAAPDMQAGRRSLPWNRTAKNDPCVKEEEESFPNTLQQPAGGPSAVKPVTMTAARGLTSQSMLPPKRPAPDPGAAMEGQASLSMPHRTLQTSQLTGHAAQATSSVVKEQLQTSHLAGGVGHQHGEYATVGSAGQAKPEAQNGLPAGVKAVKPEPGLDKLRLPPRPTLTLTPGPSLSQTKHEPAAAAEPPSQRHEVVELSQAKREQPPPSEAPPARRQRTALLVESSAPAKIEAAAPPPEPEPPPQVEPVKHQTGVWLQGLVGTPQQHRDLIPDLPRASWSPGAEVALGRRSRLAQASSGCTPNGEERRGFKAFRKAQGQLPRQRGAAIPLVPWAPAAGPPLAEVFCSQPLDSQSQIPPVLG